MTIKIYAKTIEQEALEQLNKIQQSPAFANEKIRIMPDVHAGKGCVVGFTSTFSDKVIPNIVGVDIGCGVTAVNLGQIDIDLMELDSVINSYIPSGKNVHNDFLNDTHKRLAKSLVKDLSYLADRERIELSTGTLGGGNHYLELDKSTSGDLWLVVHSGSRNLGVQVAKHYQDIAISKLYGKEKYSELAKELIQNYKQQGLEKEINDALNELKNFLQANSIEKDLAYLEGQDLKDYLHDMDIAQTFAKFNRATILAIILRKMGLERDIKNTISSIHNYIDLDNNIIRKGAIAANKGQTILIPLNMRDGLILGVGKGNPDWNYSAPHGAGRLMSRTKAKEVIQLEDFKETMSGIYSTSINNSTIDESPFAYKDKDEIIKLIQETVEITDILKPIYNFKAGE